MLVKLAGTAACLLGGAWGLGALVYQGPSQVFARTLLAGSWSALAVAAAVGLWWYPQRVAIAYGLALALLLVWWLRLEASNDRDWADEVAHLAVGRVDGDRVTLARVRHFAWRSRTDYDVHWESRTYDLRQLTSVDLILSYWGVPGIAHTLVSFGFGDGEHVAFSVEIRKEKHERFSEIGGFFKQFESSVIAADERDIVRVRTNIRGEDDYLYRIRMSPEARRSLFLAYVEQANRLAQTPRFYNTLTENCTTVVYGMVTRIVDGLPMDYRLVLSGLLPAYIHKLGGFTPGYSLDELRRRGRITQRALEADGEADFSRAIRRGIPGIDPATAD